jgi:hypothetical protein
MLQVKGEVKVWEREVVGERSPVAAGGVSVLQSGQFQRTL